MKFITQNLLGIIALICVIISFSIFAYSFHLHNNSQDGEITFLGEEPQTNLLTRQVVYLAGAVNNPGVYEITPELRMNELVQNAGGFHEDVDWQYVSASLNLAAKLQDEQQIYIPFMQEIPTTTGTVEEVGGSGNTVNLNTASLQELDTLPGIGPSTAQKIIDNRPYAIPEDLLNVSGIGDKTFENIQSLISV